MAEVSFLAGNVHADNGADAEDNAGIESTQTEDNAAYIQAEKAALALIARAEQCSHGLQHKLEKKKFHRDIIKAVLFRLNELDLVNDLRYAQLWLKMKINRGNKGPRMLLYLLKAKGIDNETAGKALTAALTPEHESTLLKSCLSNALYNKKGRSRFFPAKKSSGLKATIRQFLRFEGFSTAAIDDYFDEYDECNKEP